MACACNVKNVDSHSWPRCIDIVGLMAEKTSGAYRSGNFQRFPWQEAQLSQTERAMLRVSDYYFFNFTKSRKVTRSYSKWHPWVGRVLVPISIPLKLCLYLLPFLRHSTSNNGMTLNSGLGVIQGHWKWHQSIDYILSCIVFELFDVE